MVQKDAFEKAGKFSLQAITEDMDLAFKLNELGYKVQQSFYKVETVVPDTWKELYKQKMRRNS
jgi:cellulose synthase/poly-beta-1,6-N-acetylglucosamine synthase-like glycosyltransferase